MIMLNDLLYAVILNYSKYACFLGTCRTLFWFSSSTRSQWHSGLLIKLDCVGRQFKHWRSYATICIALFGNNKFVVLFKYLSLMQFVWCLPLDNFEQINWSIIYWCLFHNFYPHLVGAQLCQLSPVDAYFVALKPVMGKLHDIWLWNFATCTSVNCHTCVLVMT